MAQKKAQKKIALDGVPERFFRITDAGDDWHVHCRRCTKGWSLTKTSDAGGNRLYLLNHAYGHEHAKNKSALDQFFGG